MANMASKCLQSLQSTEQNISRHTHTHRQRHATLTVYDSILFRTHAFFFMCYWGTDESCQNFQKTYYAQIAREPSVAYAVIYFCMFSYLFYCVTHAGLILSNIKRTAVAYFNNIFIRLHIICRHNGSMSCSAARRDMNPILNECLC